MFLESTSKQLVGGPAEWPGISQLTMVNRVDVDWAWRTVRGRREIRGGYEILEVPLPAVSGLAQAPSRERKRQYLAGSVEEIAAQLARILQDGV
jgi:electron transfer flavoprotein alpha/beta subunit